MGTVDTSGSTGRRASRARSVLGGQGTAAQAKTSCSGERAAAGRGGSVGYPRGSRTLRTMVGACDQAAGPPSSSASDTSTAKTQRRSSVEVEHDEHERAEALGELDRTGASGNPEGEADVGRTLGHDEIAPSGGRREYAVVGELMGARVRNEWASRRAAGPRDGGADLASHHHARPQGERVPKLTKSATSLLAVVYHRGPHLPLPAAVLSGKMSR